MRVAIPLLSFVRLFSFGSDDPERPRRAGNVQARAESAPLIDKDAGWIAALRNNDTGALSVLIRRYAPGLEDYAYTFVRVDDTARDIVQDVFVALWERRANLVVKGTLASYLYGAVRNGALSALRHERSRERLAARLRDQKIAASATSLNAGAVALDEEEFWTRVNAALASLPPRCQEIFRLHRDQGLSYAEIAAMFGIGIPTVHVQMSRAVRRLQEYLFSDKK